MLVDERSKRSLEDVNVFRGAAGGMSHHYLVEAKVRMRGGFRRDRGEAVNQSCESVWIEEVEVREASERLILSECERVRDSRLLSVEEEWEFKRTNYHESQGQWRDYVNRTSSSVTEMEWVPWGFTECRWWKESTIAWSSKSKSEWWCKRQVGS